MPLNDPFGPHDYGGPPYWLRPQDTDLERHHLALLNEAERLYRWSCRLANSTTAPPSKAPIPE
jgi:hypothetical protein